MTGPKANQQAIDEPLEPKPLSVGDLDRLLKRALDTVVRVWVNGEISGLKIAQSGHAYFSLKDEHEEASIDAVAYRDTALRARALLSEGASVLVRGKATLYAPRGRLQFVIDLVKAAGRGELLEALEKLKQRLAGEGLFAAERKKLVPSGAKTIGVVTSSSGAVIHDIIQVSFRRGSVRILLAAAQVQGDGAVESIIAAIDRIEAVGGIDVLIVGRGGGSTDDLMAFNDERVVRRVAACKVPTVSAVGHEVDITLTDLVADARAATPSQAAEMVVADEQVVRRLLGQSSARLHNALDARLVKSSRMLERLASRMGDPRSLVAQHNQRLDELQQRLGDAFANAVRRRRTILDRAEKRLLGRHPRTVIEITRQGLVVAPVRLRTAIESLLGRHAAALGDRHARLKALSPLGVLARGYAIATDSDGAAIRDAASVSVGSSVFVRVQTGSLRTTVSSCHYGGSPVVSTPAKGG